VRLLCVRVLLTSASRYPARRGGNGSSRVHDALAKGLAELGHDVLYSVRDGYAAALPPGVVAADRTTADADIYHFNDYPYSGVPPPPGKPWLRTFHAPVEQSAELRPLMSEHFVFVSKAQATSYAFDRYVWNGIDPEEFVYSETKSDDFLFLVSDLSRAETKGLSIAVAIAEHLGTRLYVGANIDIPPPIQSPNVFYIGTVCDAEKAELLARSRALLFPTQMTESFGLVIAEALISGTPVIASRYGSPPELIAPDTGFTCDTLEEYFAASERLDDISPAACRRHALSEFHYRRMASRYVDEYSKEISREPGRETRL
jgi:glycosyltransferase involved in cell wall biosynthesis